MPHKIIVDAYSIHVKRDESVDDGPLLLSAYVSI